MPAKRDESHPCTKCGGKRKRSPKGLIYCEDCNKHYRQSHRERRLVRDREYYKEHKDQAQLSMKKYRERNLDKIKAYAKSEHRKNQVKDWRKRGNTGTRHPDYGVWRGALDRCFNSNSYKYHTHGARGITMFDPWRNSFEAFIDYMGPRPEPRHLYSLDRYPNNNGNYEPGNVRWATAEQQANNTRRNRVYKSSIPDNSPIYYPFGNLITLKEFAEQVKLPLIIAKYRYAQNWDAEWILNTSYDNRRHEWNGRKYNKTELSILTSKNYSTISHRINRLGWSIDRVMSE